MRRYWQFAALSKELGEDPIPVELLGQEFVLFRDAEGKPRMLDLHCPHRKADLSYGRVEEGQLRCVYHGWLFAGDGRCMEQPGEPRESTYAARIQQPAYPTREAGGIVFAYLGPGEPPVLDLPWLHAPAEYSWATKLFHDCNYLQASEGNVDPQHLSFLHRNFDPSQGREAHKYVAADAAPRIDVEETPFGLRLYAIRDIGEGDTYVRISNFIMPHGSAFPAGTVVDPAKQKLDENEHYALHFHVPIDDNRHWKYRILFRLNGPVDAEFIDRTQNNFTTESSFERPRAARNRYMQNRDEQRTRTYTGMGTNFQDHDRFATESQGRILDRTTERLATTDKPIIAMRRQMLAAIEATRRGGHPLMTDPHDTEPCSDVVVRSLRVPAGENPREAWRTPAAT